MVCSKDNLTPFSNTSPQASNRLLLSINEGNAPKDNTEDKAFGQQEDA